MPECDQTARTILELEPEAMLSWLAARAELALSFAEWFRERTPPRHDSDERVADQVAILTESTARRWLFLVECQTTPDADKLDVTFEHAASLRSRTRWGPERLEKYRVLTAIVHLTGRLAEEELDMLSPNERGSYHAPVIWNVADESASGVLDQVERAERHPAFLHWLPLMRGGGDETIITRWKSLAENLVPDLRKRADLVYSALEFSELTRCYLTWERILKGWNVSESIIARKVRNEGVLLARQRDLLRVLELRYRALLTDEVRRLIETQETLSLLDDWFDAAVQATSYDDFLAVLRR